jgi:hypothetical protein
MVADKCPDCRISTNMTGGLKSCNAFAMGRMKIVRIVILPCHLLAQLEGVDGMWKWYCL